MEEHPRLNAGYGSALTERGTVECDASIMEGDTLQAGAVGAVSGVRSAIGLARRILEDGRHILLVGDGAHAFARDHGVPLCSPDALVTDPQRRSLAEHLAAARETTRPTSGTVGAVAIDVHGRIVAGTSTGGYTGKRPGRVGDSALIGSGTYADSRLGGVSTTGHGEAFIRTVLAKTALDILKELDDPQLAADVSLDIVREEGRGNGGLILMDWRGRLAYATSTTFMPVGWCQGTAADPVLRF
jgi:L-asparaginase / beta-aspartyl-peptidase